MARRSSRQACLRDLGREREALLEMVDEDGNLLAEPMYQGPLEPLPIAELRRRVVAEGATSRPVGRPRRWHPVGEHIDAIKRNDGVGVLEACRRYLREAAVMFTARRRARLVAEERDAATLARRYYREKKG